MPYAMNTQVQDTTGSCPYKLVFGQKPRSVLFLSDGVKRSILEEDRIKLDSKLTSIDQIVKDEDVREAVGNAKKEALCLIVEESQKAVFK